MSEEVEPQWVQVAFSSGPRLYTYRNTGERVERGDIVEVDTPRDGKKRVKVVTAWTGNPPNFECKPCTKVTPPPAEPEAGAAT